jgi:hypothetical protein
LATEKRISLATEKITSLATEKYLIAWQRNRFPWQEENNKFLAPAHLQEPDELDDSPAHAFRAWFNEYDLECVNDEEASQFGGGARDDGAGEEVAVRWRRRNS